MRHVFIEGIDLLLELVFNDEVRGLDQLVEDGYP